jgi:very-short-patch-repair endonuclease
VRSVDILPWWEGIATIDALVSAGLTARTARGRIRAGRWQEPAPGVVCQTSGQLTPRQWLIAGVEYGGPSALLSHTTAGAAWGFCAPERRRHVTVDHGHHVSSTDQIAIHQSLRSCEPRFLDELPFTPPARTVIDICGGLTRLDDVRHLMGRAVQKKLTTPQQLATELAAAPRRGSRLPTLALEEISAGAHAASEARFRQIVRRAGLPRPELNAPVETREGTKYVDALWRHLNRGVELDGHRYHLDPAAWAADLVRQNAIQATGIILMRIAAGLLWSDEQRVIHELTAFLGLAA